MQVNVTFRHFDPSDSLKSFAREKVEHIEKLLDQPGEASVVLSIQKHLHQAEIVVRSGPFHIQGREKSDDMYASIGLAVDKVERQLKRYKGRLRQYKPARHHQEQALRVKQAIIESAASEEVEANKPSRVVETDELVAQRMTVDEALLQLEISESEFLVFTNAETGHIAVLHRRPEEGNFGLIDARPAS